MGCIFLFSLVSVHMHNTVVLSCEGCRGRCRARSKRSLYLGHDGDKIYVLRTGFRRSSEQQSKISSQSSSCRTHTHTLLPLTPLPPPPPPPSVCLSSLSPCFLLVSMHPSVAAIQELGHSHLLSAPGWIKVRTRDVKG